MDFGQIINFATVLAQGGPAAVIALLVLMIAYFYRENVRLKATLAEKELKIDRIVDDYYKGSITLADALNSLKQVLFSLRDKM